MIPPDRKNIFSENEKIVGRWIDGKPIYRKTFQGKSIDVSAKDITIDIKELNIDWLIKYESMARIGTNYYRPLGTHSINNIQDGTDVFVRIAENTLVIRVGAQTQLTSYHITLYYTKK